MPRKHCTVSCPEAYNYQFKMLDRGRRLAKFIPGYRLMGVDPGYLFVPTDPYNHHSGIDLPEDVVDALLMQLERKQP